MTEAVLSVDIGTTSLKAGLISAEGEVLSFYKTSFAAPQNRFVAEAWFWALKGAVDKLDKSNISIVALSFSGNGPTIVSDSGFTLRWNEEVEKLSFDDDDYPIKTKSLFLPKIVAFKNLFPEEFDNTEYIYSGPEYLMAKLTCRAVTILPEKRFISAYWTDSELDSFKIGQGKMPPFVSIGQNCGYLIDEAAEFLNLPANIPVFSGGPDFIAALIGTNTLSAGKLCDRSGSSEGFNLCIDKELYADGIRTLPSVIPGLWNASVLIPKSSSLSAQERLAAVEKAVSKLRVFAEKNGIPFPAEMTVTGGQTKDEAYMLEKAKILNLKLNVGRCSDSELIGDACAAWVGLGKYKSIAEAAEKLF